MKIRILSIGITFLLTTSCTQNLNEKIDDTNEAIENLNNRITEIQESSSDSRFKIVQSNIAARGTYKLDSYNGEVYQMVADSKGNKRWDLLRRIGHSNNNTQIEGKSNYEIFLSTIAMRFTYLINVNTGASWQLVHDPETEENFFNSIE